MLYDNYLNKAGGEGKIQIIINKYHEIRFQRRKKPKWTSIVKEDFMKKMKCELVIE